MKKKKPDFWHSYFMLYENYLEKYKLRFCNRYLKSHRSCADAYRDRGYIYDRKKKYRQAIKDFSKSLQLDRNYFIYYSRSNAYAGLGQFQKAVEDLSKAIDLVKKEKRSVVLRIDELYDKRVGLYLKLNKYKRAVNDLKNEIKIGSNNIRCYKMLADIYSSYKNPKIRNGIKAVYYAKKTIAEYRRDARKRKGPKHVPWFYLETLAASYAQSGDFKQAVRVQKKVMSMVKRYKHVWKSYNKFLKEREHRLRLYKQKMPFYGGSPTF
jgi:tetratricopeptide (TPR) repeat protein